MEILASGETPLSIVQYDDAVDEPLQRLLKLSADIGGDLQIVVCPSNRFSLLLKLFFLLFFFIFLFGCETKHMSEGS